MAGMSVGVEPGGGGLLEEESGRLNGVASLFAELGQFTVDAGEDGRVGSELDEGCGAGSGGVEGGFRLGPNALFECSGLVPGQRSRLESR